MNPLARLEALLDSILNRSEDPEERIRALVADLRRRHAQGRRALGLAIGLELRLLGELCAAEDSCAAWERTSKEALAAGDEAAAQAASVRLLEARGVERERRERYDGQRAVASNVRGAVALAARRIDEVALARSVALARARCAEAMQSIADTLTLLESAGLERTIVEAQLSAEKKEALAGAAQAGPEPGTAPGGTAKP